MICNSRSVFKFNFATIELFHISLFCFLLSLNLVMYAVSFINSTSLDPFETSLNQFDQVWTGLDKFGQVWTSLDHFEKLILLSQYPSLIIVVHNVILNFVILLWLSCLWISLHKFEQFLTSLIKFDQVWTCLTYLPLLLFPCWIKESFSLPLFILLHICCAILV